MDIKNETIREMNKRSISEDNECRCEIQEMRKIEDFTSKLGALLFGRDYVVLKNSYFSLQRVSTSFELTAGSIINCCESGCIADAYSLLRKYRDDMFFYLYIMIYEAEKKLENDLEHVTRIESCVKKWMTNDLKNLNITTVLKDISQSTKVQEAVNKYGMKDYFQKIGKTLNDYVHSNGISFYNMNINEYKNGEFLNALQSLTEDMRLITVTFLFLLTLCSPLSIMANDLLDYLECGLTPPEGAQYWVAPFIVEFFKNNLDLIDESCRKYLRDNTYMEFE